MRRTRGGFADLLQISIILASGAAMLVALIRESVGTLTATLIAVVLLTACAVLTWMLDDPPRPDADDQHVITDSRLERMHQSGVPAEVTDAMAGLRGQVCTASELQQHLRSSIDDPARHEESVLLHTRVFRESP